MSLDTQREIHLQLLQQRGIVHDLLAALEGLLKDHCSLVDSGDCGFWNVEEETEVIQARAAIKEAKK